MNDPSFLFFVFMIIVGSSMLLHHIFMEAKKEPITTPLLFNKFIRKDNNMALVYEFGCELPLDSDVVERRLSVVAGDGEPIVKSYPANTSNFGEFSFEENVHVVITLVDVDDAGNVSEPAVASFTTSDTIAPRVPVGFAVSLIKELSDPVKPEETIPDPSGIEGD